MDQEAILALLQSDPARVYTLPEILKRAGVPPEREKSARRTLKSLVRSGVLEREQGRRYRISRAGQEIEGTIVFDARNHALLRTDVKGPPIALAEDEVQRVEANDRVLARLAVRGKRGKLEAHIVEVLDRPKIHQLGVFRRLAKTTFVELESGPERDRRAKRLPRSIREVLVPPEQTLNADDGQLVEVEISRKGRGSTASATARVIRILGKVGARETEVARLMLEHHLEPEFPSDVVAETAHLGSVPTEEDTRGRRDLRDIPLVTIDSETAKDFDDAIATMRHGGDGYRLYVAVADVSHYVRPNTALDREALRRGTSTYLTDRAIPMLPEALSNELCSLKPHVDRLCMVADLTIDRTGHIEKSEFYPAVMRSHARLTYTRVARALEGDPDDEAKALLPMLLLSAKVAQLLLAKRLKRGAIDLDLPEPVVVFDDNRVPIDVSRRPRNDAHRLIEDLMLAANEAVAQFFVDRRLPSIFRIHEDPDPARLEAFRALLLHLGFPIKLKRRPHPQDMALLLDKLNEQEGGKPLHTLLLRSLAQARYDSECKGHYGLAAESYLHFTSPIRRYPDLMVHRLMKHVLTGEAPPLGKVALQEVAVRSSEAERRAMLAERECMDLDRAYVALEHLGEKLTGVISAVQAFGLFVAAEAPFVEGLVPVASLPEDYYELDDYGAMLKGTNTARTFMLGQKIEIEVVSVNIARRQVEFRLWEPDQEDGGRRAATPVRSPKAPKRAKGAKHPKRAVAREPPKTTKRRKRRR
jgi:ribonuclease R